MSKIGWMRQNLRCLSPPIAGYDLHFGFHCRLLQLTDGKYLEFWALAQFFKILLFSMINILAKAGILIPTYPLAEADGNNKDDFPFFNAKYQEVLVNLQIGSIKKIV